MRLGRKPVRRDSRTLKLARYLTAELPAPPPCVDWSKPVASWGVHLNDSLGCCTIAAVANAVETWTANCGREQVIPDSDVLKYYESWDGYNPADPATDQGGVELDVLNNWRQQQFSGVELDAFAAVNVVNSGMVKQAIYLFGGLYIGVDLPLAAQKQDVWDVTANPGPDDEPGSWGGHAIYLTGYDSHYLDCVTWGQMKAMTWAWFNKYCSEAYALVSKAWIEANEATNVSPSGFALAALEADLQAITA